MISLDVQIKKDKENRGSDKGGMRQNRDRSRDNYRSRDGRRQYNRDEERRNDYSRKDNSSKNRHQKQDKTIVKFTQLHYSVTKQQLKEICQRHGNVKFCKIHWDKMGRSKETAIVGYFNQSDAQRAAEELNHMKFEGTQVLTQLSLSQRSQHRNTHYQWNSRNRNDHF